MRYIKYEDSLPTDHIKSIIHKLIKQNDMPKTTPKKAVKKPSTPRKKKDTLKSGGDTWVWEGKLPKEFEGSESIRMEGTYEFDRDAELMKDAARTIKSLRESNQQMATRLDMFDKMYDLFTNNNHRYGGEKSCGSDIVSNLEYRAEEKIKDFSSKK